MQSQKWQDRQISYGQLARILVTVALFILLVVAWILSSKGIISVIWSIIFTGFSGSITIYQVVPRLLGGIQHTVVSFEQTPPQHIFPLPTISAEDDAYRTFIGGERQRLYDSPNPHGTGTLIARANKSLAGEVTVPGINNKMCYISERTEAGQTLYVGIIKDIPEGNYSAITAHGYGRPITIHAREVTEVDLRN